MCPLFSVCYLHSRARGNESSVMQYSWISRRQPSHACAFADEHTRMQPHKQVSITVANADQTVLSVSFSMPSNLRWPDDHLTWKKATKRCAREEKAYSNGSHPVGRDPKMSRRLVLIGSQMLGSKYNVKGQIIKSLNILLFIYTYRIYVNISQSLEQSYIWPGLQ